MHLHQGWCEPQDSFVSGVFVSFFNFCQHGPSDDGRISAARPLSHMSHCLGPRPLSTSVLYITCPRYAASLIASADAAYYCESFLLLFQIRFESHVTAADHYASITSHYNEAQQGNRTGCHGCLMTGGVLQGGHSCIRRRERTLDNRCPASLYQRATAAAITREDDGRCGRGRHMIEPRVF